MESQSHQETDGSPPLFPVRPAVLALPIVTFMLVWHTSRRSLRRRIRVVVVVVRIQIR